MKFSLYSEPKQSSLKEFFIHLEEKMEMYEHHIEVTTKFYASELEKSLKPIIEEYEREKIPAEESYNTVYATTGGSEHERHIIAEYASGRDSMYEYSQYLRELCEEQYDEMFDYFNKSSILMLYSIMESEMKRLCIILKEMKGARISIDDFKNTNYIKGYFKYLDLVIYLPFATLEEFITKIEHIQYVRNRIVHGSSEVSILTDNDEKKALQNAIDNSYGLLRQVYDPKIGRTYLRIFDSQYVKKGYQLFKDLVHELFHLVNIHFDYPLLKEELKDLFKKSYEDAVFTVLDASKVKKGIKLKLEVTNNNQEGVPESLMVNITITKSEADELEVIDQSEGNKKIHQLGEHIKQQKNLVYRYFKGWVSPDPNLKIQFTFF